MPAESASVPVSTRSMSTPARILLRLDLAREFRSRRLGEGDPRNEVRLRLAVVFDGLLRQRQIAGDVDDVERDRARSAGRAAQSSWPPRAATPAAPATPPTKVRLVIGSSWSSSRFCATWPHERPRPVSQLVGLFREAIGKIVGDLVRLVLVEAMGGHEIGEIGAIHTARHVVPRRNGQIGPRVVVEADGVVEARPSPSSVRGSAACPPAHRRTTRPARASAPDNARRAAQARANSSSRRG